MDLQARQELIKDFIRHFGEGVNKESITPKLPQQLGTRLPLDPASAVRIIMAGMPVDALPTENHSAYVDYLGRFAQSKEYDMLPEWQAALIANLHRQHQMMLVAEQQQGGAANEQAGLSNNVPQSLGDLEGGVA